MKLFKQNNKHTLKNDIDIINNKMLRNKIVRINWSEHFSIAYLRLIRVIEDDNGKFGHIIVGHYLNSSEYTRKKLYQDGELYIIGESESSFYYLVQVDNQEEKGFKLLDRVKKADSYPWHENQLVATILKSNRLRKSVTVIR